MAAGRLAGARGDGNTRGSKGSKGKGRQGGASRWREPRRLLSAATGKGGPTPEPAPEAQPCAPGEPDQPVKPKQSQPARGAAGQGRGKA